MGVFFSSIANGFNAWLDKLHFTFIESDRYMTLIDGFIKTLQITFGALVIGVVIGIIDAIDVCSCHFSFSFSKSSIFKQWFPYQKRSRAL